MTSPITPRFETPQAASRRYLQPAAFKSTASALHLAEPGQSFHRTSPAAIKFRGGGQRFYTGSFNAVDFFTDFNDGSSNGESINNFRDVLNFSLKNKPLINDRLKQDLGKYTPPTGSQKFLNQVKLAWQAVKNLGLQLYQFFTGKSGFLEVKTFADTPYGNRDYSSLTLQRLAQRKNNEIHIHVTDPGVGNAFRGDKQVHDRTILITKNNGILIGPNNGSLGVLAKSLEQKGEKYELLPIDLRKVEDFLKLKNGESFTLPHTFHARDAFAVVGGAIAGGIDPHLFADKARQSEAPLKVEYRDFANTIQTLPEGITKSGTTFQAFQDKTFGNAKTNLILKEDAFEKLLAEKAEFNINDQEGTLNEGKGYRFPLKENFSQVEPGKELIYLGSTYSPVPEHRFIELAINLGSVSDKRLGLGFAQAQPLVIKRVK